MPKVSTDWRELANTLVEDDANKVLDSMKSITVTSCNQPVCTTSTDPIEHKMKYQLLKCTSASCKATCPQLSCGWRGKVMTCNRSRKVTVLESGNHFTEVRSPRKAGLTREQKKYCHELTPQRMKPVRVRNALRLKFGLEGDRIPRLRAVQNFVNYYSKTQLGCNDEHEDISEAVQAMAYEAGESESTPISFTYGKTSDGRLVVGDGSDEEPFVVGITTKALLKRLDRDPSTFIFHIDATFKLSQVNYPVLVMGISDRARKSNLVAVVGLRGSLLRLTRVRTCRRKRRASVNLDKLYTSPRV